MKRLILPILFTIAVTTFSSEADACNGRIRQRAKARRAFVGRVIVRSVRFAALPLRGVRAVRARSCN